jgi:hypothetical protein
MSDTHVFVDTDGIIRQTAMAELHGLDAGETWIPKSIIGARAKGRIEIPRWWAKQEGLIDEKDAS